MENEKRIGMPVLGAKLPTMEVETTHGMMTIPEDYEGKWFVLFSHPADFTPVCTTEFVGFANQHERFQEIGAELIGLSIDGVVAHIKWVEWIKDNMDVDVKFPIIADQLGRVANELGMVHEAKGTDTVRAVFIVDDKGILRTMMYYPQEAGRSIDEIFRATKALQTADKNSVAMPENWPANAIHGDDVIIPPAKTVELAKERAAELKDDDSVDYRDWWFITKKFDEKK